MQQRDRTIIATLHLLLAILAIAVLVLWLSHSAVIMPVVLVATVICVALALIPIGIGVADRSILFSVLSVLFYLASWIVLLISPMYQEYPIMEFATLVVIVAVIPIGMLLGIICIIYMVPEETVSVVVSDPEISRD